jgi:hypothetical protein
MERATKLSPRYRNYTLGDKKYSRDFKFTPTSPMGLLGGNTAPNPQEHEQEKSYEMDTRSELGHTRSASLPIFIRLSLLSPARARRDIPKSVFLKNDCSA